MADPGYDFFATGAHAPAPSSAPEPPAATSRFGGPPAAEPEPVVALAAPLAPPPPAPLAEPVYGGAYQPGAVNQFGTPLELAAVPTGPYAAAGIGAAPATSAGIVSTWDQPGAAVAPPVSRVSPPPEGAPVLVSRFGTPLTPEEYAASLQPLAPVHRGPAPRADRPGAVQAAGIIGIVVGALSVLLGVFGVFGWSVLRSRLDVVDAATRTADDASTVADLGSLTSAVLTFMLIGALIFLVLGIGYLVSAIAVVRGARWGAWVMLVVAGLSALVTVRTMLTSGVDFSTTLTLGVDITIAVLLAGLADSRRWLTGG